MEIIKKTYEPTKFVQTSHAYSGYTYLKDTAGMEVFVKGLKEKKIIGVRCKYCNKVYVPPTFMCRFCFEELDLTNTVECKDYGKVLFFSVTLADIRGNPVENPVVTAGIRFEGSDSIWFGTIKNAKAPDDVKVGDKVRVIWKDNPEGKLADIEGLELVK